MALLRLFLLVLSLLEPDTIDVNTADSWTLEQLPGIGPSTAASIIEFRERFGPFLLPEDLELVDGIGPATLGAISGLIILEADSSVVVADTLHWLECDLPDSIQLTLSILDVGMGDAILIEAEGGQSWLVDGGPDLGGPLAPPVMARLDQLSVTHLDAVFLTHPHGDHVGGLPYVIRNLDVDRVLDPGLAFASPLYKDFLVSILEENVEYQMVRSGDRFDLSPSVSISVLRAGPEEGLDLSLNDMGAVLLLQCGGFTALLTGDIEEGAEMLLSPLVPPVVFLKVPHHGSAGSLFPYFLRRLRPQIAAISVGRDNPFGHPHPSMLESYEEMGAAVLRTDLDGTIFIRTDGVRVFSSKSR